MDQRQLQLNDIAQKLKNQDLSAQDAKILRDKANKDADKAIETADKARADKDAQVRRQEIQTEIADKNAAIDQELQLQKSALQREVSATENAFQQEKIYATQYVHDRIAQINAEVEAVQQAQEKKIAANPKNLKTIDAAHKAISQAIDQAHSQLHPSLS